MKRIIKFIDKIEKSKVFWSLLVLSIVFFLLRLPSVIEPNWYGDEGIYQVLGSAMNHGQMLYSGAWDNKPPLLYVTYALFGSDHFSVRFASLVVGLITTWAFFLLGKTLFNNLKASILTTIVFVFFFATPIIEGNIANAENFMLLPIIGAALLIYHVITNKTSHKPLAINHKLFLAGLLLGIAFLFKIVALFDFAAFFIFFIIISLPHNLSWSNLKHFIKHESSSLLHNSCFIILGFFLPLLITVCYFAVNHALPDFIRATFFGNVGYVGYGNEFFIPQGLLILKLILLGGFVLFATIRHKKFSSSTLFVLLWLAFSLFNAFFSNRPYTHYMLVMLPSFCLLLGLLLSSNTRKAQAGFLFIALAVVYTIFTLFSPLNFKKTALYYQNTLLFVTNQRDITTYQTFFDKKTPRDYALASYIKLYSKPNDPLFIWGDSAQIYTLSRTLPITKYTVAYHIRQSQEGFDATQKALDTIKPRFVIILSESPSFPFQLGHYTSRFSLDRAIIYERSF